MRKVVMYCDRCKKEFEKWNHKKSEVYGIAELVYTDNSDPYLNEPKDLCESCYTELENWWNCKSLLNEKVKTAQWKHAYDECMPYLYCSNCGLDVGAMESTNYCPNCGAKMWGGLNK